jgi:hypothetical protein
MNKEGAYIIELEQLEVQTSKNVNSGLIYPYDLSDTSFKTILDETLDEIKSSK